MYSYIIYGDPKNKDGTLVDKRSGLIRRLDRQSGLCREPVGSSTLKVFRPWKVSDHSGVLSPGSLRFYKQPLYSLTFSLKYLCTYLFTYFVVGHTTNYGVLLRKGS